MLLKAKKGEIDVTVTTADALSPAQEKALQSSLKNQVRRRCAFFVPFVFCVFARLRLALFGSRGIADQSTEPGMQLSLKALFLLLRPFPPPLKALLACPCRLHCIPVCNRRVKYLQANLASYYLLVVP